MRSLITRFSILSGLFFSALALAVTPMARRKAMRRGICARFKALWIWRVCLDVAPRITHSLHPGSTKLPHLMVVIALSLFGLSSAHAAEIEPNNTKAAANSISFGVANSGVIQGSLPSPQTSDFVDYYKFTLTAANNLTITGKPQTTGANNLPWQVDVYNSATDVNVLSFTFTETAAAGQARQLGLPAGDYYMKLTAYNSSLYGVPYVLQIDAVAGTTFEQEPNDSKLGAQTIALGAAYVGNIQNRIGVADADYYKFTLTAANNLTITGRPQTTGAFNLPWQVDVYNSATDVNVLSFTFTDTAAAGQARQLGLPAGDYYMKLTAYNSSLSGVPYVFSVSLSTLVNSISPFTPTSGAAGTTATVTVNGSNFPNTLIINIAGQSIGCTRQSISVTQGVFTCPLDVAGIQLFEVKTDTLINGGVAFYTATFTVNAAAVPIASSVTPTSARLDIPQDFTVTGTNLTTGMAFTIADCEPESGPGAIPEIGTGTATQRTFRCVPRLPGPKQLIFKDAPGGNPLFTTTVNIDHPARLGNASSRGIPATNGVSLWNGNLHLEATDLAVPGKGVSFALTRSYNSYSWSYEAARGSVSDAAPWRFNWDLKLGYVGANTNQMWVQREDGSGENFFKDTDGIWYPMDQGNFNTIKGDTPVVGQTTLMTREGLKYVFQNPDLGGKLIGIFDHDGNGLTIARDASGRVGTVTDASNRNYTFTYDANGNLFQVSDFTNRYVEYTWEVGASGVRLKTVRDVRGGITTYNYSLYSSNLVQNQPAAQFLLTSIVDPRLNTARTFTYTDKVYGNWGANSAKDALGNTWSFVYCAKQLNATSCSNGSTQIDPTAAISFETTTTPPLGAATVARFDTGGRLIEQVDANAKLSKTTPTPLAGLTSKTYNLAALPTQKQSALGVTGNYGTSYSYTPDNAGNLAALTNAENATTNRTWLGSTTLIAKNLHRVSQFASATGSLHGFTYTGTGNVQTYTPPNLPSTALAYDAAGQVTGVTDGRNNTSSRVYDTNGNLTKVTGPDTFFEQNTYDSLGRVQTNTDKRGNRTTNTYDAAGNLITVQDALNGTVTYAYDGNGNRSQMTDARNNVTRYTYDFNNRLKTVGKVNGAQTLTTTYNYDVLGRTTSTVNANTHADSTTYDGEGNVLNRANALAHTTQYVYDADNRVTRTTDPEDRVTDTSYDKVGRVKSVTTAAGTTSYLYDGDGRMTSSTDPRLKITRYAYDAAGRFTALTDANSQVTRATYDANSNMLTVVDPNGKTTTYTYDMLNRPLTRTDANGQQWVTTYDQNGNIKTSTVPGNKTTTYTYDALDRVSRIDYPDASFVSYTYDANGNRLTMTDSTGTGTTSYSYDALDRMSSKTDPQGKTVSYSYDGIGNVTTLGYPGGQSVNYFYDAGERLTSLTDWLNKTTAYTLNRAGQVTAALFGNNSRADMVYDTAGRMTSLTNKKADGSVISSHVMTLDANGNITNSTQQLPLQPSLTNFNRVFTYDPGNRLATLNGAAVSHDVAGRITGLAGASYSYNDRDQITAITGSQTASYAYNGEGHRVLRNINGAITRFVIDPNRGLPEVVAETNDAGAVQRNYVYGYGLVEQIDSSNAASYYHYDPTGSTLALTNAAGAVSDSYAYTPYGETTASGSTVNPFRYVGKLGVMDDGNGMQYMRARYYRPDVARFMSLDQLAGSADRPQSLNRYAYVLGNPVMGVDPSGLYSVGEFGGDLYAVFVEGSVNTIKNSGATSLKEVFSVGFGDTANDINAECKASPYQPGAASWLWCLAVASTKISGQALDNLNVPLQISKAHMRTQIKTIHLDKSDEKELIWISDLAHDLFSIGKFLQNAEKLPQKIREANAKIAKFRAARYLGKKGVVSKATASKNQAVEEILSTMKDLIGLAEKIFE